MKKVLITGAAGFLGKECATLFKNSGFSVITTDKVGQVDMQGDLSNPDFVSLLPAVEVVINCAAVQYVSKDLPIFFRGIYFYKNNVLSAKNLSVRYRNDTHFIHVGTSMMYVQDGAEHFEGSSKFSGEGAYSKSKFKAQQYIDLIENSATVIPCIIGGRGREGLFKGFVSLIQRFQCVIFPGNGLHAVHMVHVSDVSSLILKIVQTTNNGYFNAASLNPLSIRQWVDEISQALQIKKVRIFSLPLYPFVFISNFFGFRLLAKEQLLMLKLSHVLSLSKSLSIGWVPRYTNADVAREIALHIASEL